MAKKQRTTREAVIHVLQKNGGVMTTKEIVKAAIPLATSLKGKTKEHTVYTTTLAESKRPHGLVVQVEPGKYRAKTAEEIEALKASAEQAAPPPEKAQTDEVGAASVQVEPDPRPARTRRSRSTARETAAV